ncbi:MAG: DUF4388 domain-containing protein [Polyangiaceae bacterium]
MTGPHRVLLLEDEEALRKSMVRGLAKLPGLEVVDVGTVTEAKAALATSPAPALVISDLSLPDGLGVEVATELGRLGIPAPVVFVSAYVGKFKHHLPERGDFEVYEKPVPLEVLRGVVERKLDLADKSAPSPFGVPDYVQLAALGRHSVVIEVSSAVGRARIVIVRGEVWSAEDKLGKGMDAFRRLVFLGTAQVSCRTLPKATEVPERNIHGSAESILLDVMREHDEAERTNEPSGVVDDGWGDVLTDAGARRASRPPVAPTRATAHPSTRPPPRASTRPPRGSVPPPKTPPSPRAPGFAESFERGVDALLAKDYPKALTAFREASVARPDDRRVIANLERLKAMGFS